MACCRVKVNPFCQHKAAGGLLIELRYCFLCSTALRHLVNALQVVNLQLDEVLTRERCGYLAKLASEDRIPDASLVGIQLLKVLPQSINLHLQIIALRRLWRRLCRCRGVYVLLTVVGALWACLQPLQLR
jgi:hypothetical protein